MTYMGVGKAKGASAPLHPDFKLMLLCVLVIACKEHPKFAVMNKKKQERKKNSFEVISIVSHTKLEA